MNTHAFSSAPERPLDMVIFGGAGDLAARKPLPALYMAHLHSSLPPETRIIAVGRSGWTRERYLTFELKHGDCDIDCASIERRLSPH
jgi:glucose-6-phosphate 1-dehydrogenase